MRIKMMMIFIIINKPLMRCYVVVYCFGVMENVNIGVCFKGPNLFYSLC